MVGISIDDVRTQGGIPIRDVRFPEGVPFPDAGTDEAHISKLLEEAAEFVEAVKDFEASASASVMEDGIVRVLDHEQDRRHVLDEGMDVYQAIVNYAPTLIDAWPSCPPLHEATLSKEGAMQVLKWASHAYGMWERWKYRDPDDVRKTQERVYLMSELLDTYHALAAALSDEFSNAEIEEGYRRCVERNRERGRYE